MARCILLAGGGGFQTSALEAQSVASHEARLLEAAKLGDREAAGRLLELHRPLIQGYLKRRTRGQDDCDDLVQNVFLRASRNLESFRSDCPLSQWLLRIAANELKNYYERTLGRRENEAEDFDWENSLIPQQIETGPGPYDEAQDRSVASQIMDFAKKVCGQDEFAVLMMFYQGESFEEIAGLLKMKGATVRSHFLRARGKLLAFLVNEEPTMVGGREAIQSAMSKAQADQSLQAKECEAMARRDCRSETFRNACVKIAKHLPLPALLLMLEGPWTI